MGDLNAKVGKEREVEIVGKFGLKNRIERREGGENGSNSAGRMIRQQATPGVKNAQDIYGHEETQGQKRKTTSTI